MVRMTKTIALWLLGSDCTSRKMQQFSSASRIAVSGCVLSALLFNCLLIAGCVPSSTFGEIIDGYLSKEIEIENAHFELQDLPYPIQPALAYWLRRSDNVAPKWDTFEFHFEREDAMCEFLDNTSGGDCHICDACNLPPSIVGPPCFGIYPVFGLGVVQVVADNGFMKTETPQTIVSFEGNAEKVIGTCANNTISEVVPFFAAEMSGSYRFTVGQPIGWSFKLITDGEIKLHTVEENQPQAVPYQLTYQRIGMTDFWTWTMQGDPTWLENFSPTLQVNKIRIRKGVCTEDPATGRKCAVPDGAQVVKPSRILFMPNFIDFSGSEVNYVCHDDPSAAEGYYISPLACLPTNAMSPSPIPEVKQVTPTYLKFGGDNGGARPLERITWLVEFNTNEGADADLTTPTTFDPMPTDEVLIIEFVIEALVRR